jgi:hypothetical protein
VTVGKKAKKKKRQHLERHRFEQIQAEVSGRLQQLLEETEREAAAFVDALGATLTDSRAAAREGIDEIAASSEDVRNRCAALREEAEHDRAAIQGVLVAMGAVADDLETRVRVHVERITTRGGASLTQLEQTLAEARVRAMTGACTEIDRAAAEARTRFEASQRAIDEEVQRLRKEMARQVALVSTEADRAVQGFARLGIEHAVAEVEEPGGEASIPTITPAHEAGEARGPTVDDLAGDATAEDPIWHDLARATLTDEADPLDDEYFFSRLAEELRAEPNQGDYPSHQELRG